MAYQCLYHVDDRPLLEGDRVLVVGGTGAIGQAVVELALEGGARWVYATGTGNKVSRLLRSKGVIILDRDPAEWLRDVEGNMDIVVDLVGLDGYEASMKAVKADGTGKIVCAGVPRIQKQAGIGNIVVDAAAKLVKNVSDYDFFASIENDPEGYKEDLREVFRLLKQKQISPRISKFVLLNEVDTIHEAIEAGGLDGHVICRPNPTKNFVYNAKDPATYEPGKETADTRDADLPSMLDERSFASNEDQSEYSRSVISKALSGESDFTDFTDASSEYGNASNANSLMSDQTGDSTYNTFELFPEKRKMGHAAACSGVRGASKASAFLGGISTLAAIRENIASCTPAEIPTYDDNEEIETQTGSIQTTQERNGEEGTDSASTSGAPERQELEVQQYNPNYSPEPSPRNNRRWMPSLPSSPKATPAGLQTANWDEEQSTDASPFVSAQKNVQVESDFFPSNPEATRNSAVGSTYGPIEGECFMLPGNDEKMTGTIEMMRGMACLWSNSGEEIDKGVQDEGNVMRKKIETGISSNVFIRDIQSLSGKAQTLFEQAQKKNNDDGDNQRPYFANKHAHARQHIVDAGVRGALSDLFGLGLISPSSSGRKPARPDQITISQDQQDEPSVLEADLGIVDMPSDPETDTVDDNSTFIATGNVLQTPSPGPLPQMQRQQVSPELMQQMQRQQVSPELMQQMQRQQVSPELMQQMQRQQVSPELMQQMQRPQLSSGPLPQMQRPQVADELSALTGGTRALSPTHEKQRVPLNLPSIAREQSMSRSSGLKKSSATPVAPSLSPTSRQIGASATSGSMGKTTYSNSSAVSIKCGQSQRQFHVPSTVASSAMTVASFQSSSSRSRNIYAKRTSPQHRGTVQRLPAGGNKKERSVIKSIFSKKK